MRDNFKEYADTLLRSRLSDRRSECSDLHSPDVRSRAQSQDKFSYLKPFHKSTSSIEVAHIETSTAENSKPKLDSFLKPAIISIQHQELKESKPE